MAAKQPSPLIRILLVDDHRIVREGLRRYIAAEPGLEIAGEASDGSGAMEMAERLRPDVIVMDIGLPDGDGLAFAREILSRSPDQKIVILSALMDRRHLDEAIQSGIAGYVLKVNAASELIRAIRSASKDEPYLCAEAAAAVMGGYRELLADRERRNQSLLSDRELEVLKRIADGLNTKEIARDLGLSVKTVEAHRVRLMAKLDLHSVAELTKYAVRRGLSSL